MSKTKNEPTTSSTASAPQSAGAPADAGSAEKAAPSIEELQAENEALAAENAELKAKLDALTIASGKPLVVNVGKQAYELHGKAVTLSPRKIDNEATQALYGTYPAAEAAKNQALLQALVDRGHGQLVPVEA